VAVGWGVLERTSSGDWWALLGLSGVSTREGDCGFVQMDEGEVTGEW
jgi:hypothetical protein